METIIIIKSVYLFILGILSVFYTCLHSILAIATPVNLLLFLFVCFVVIFVVVFNSSFVLHAASPIPQISNLESKAQVLYMGVVSPTFSFQHCFHVEMNKEQYLGES